MTCKWVMGLMILKNIKKYIIQGTVLHYDFCIVQKLRLFPPQFPPHGETGIFRGTYYYYLYIILSWPLMTRRDIFCHYLCQTAIQ
jgi:hypothetical protein